MGKGFVLYSVPFRVSLRHGEACGCVVLEALSLIEAAYLTIGALGSILGHEDVVGDEILAVGPVEVVDGSEIDPSDYSRFKPEEIVLAAIPVNNMIDAIPAHQLAWELATISAIPSGGPELYFGASEDIHRFALVPHGVRKFEVELHDCH